MAQLDLPLLERKQIAEDTFEISFPKPADFSFLPGQYVQLILPDTAELPPKESIRLLSMASAPFEDTLSFAFRVSESKFKQFVLTTELKTQFSLRGPFGYFTLDEKSTNPVVCIAGGIGVTPFISMLTDETERKSKRPIILLYSNPSPNTTAYLAELEKIAKVNTNFSFYLSEKRLTWHTILEKTQFSLEHLWYIAGSTNMVGSIMQQLLEHDIPPYKIHTELFTGEQEEGGCENCTCGRKPQVPLH